jgi:hypothetical protein
MAATNSFRRFFLTTWSMSFAYGRFLLCLLAANVYSAAEEFPQTSGF